jgi:hypothetical protein
MIERHESVAGRERLLVLLPEDPFSRTRGQASHDRLRDFLDIGRRAAEPGRRVDAAPATEATPEPRRRIVRPFADGYRALAERLGEALPSSRRAGAPTSASPVPTDRPGAVRPAPSVAKVWTTDPEGRCAGVRVGQRARPAVHAGALAWRSRSPAQSHEAAAIAAAVARQSGSPPAW